MSWKMKCPKCGSLNLDLERDRRVAGIRGPHQVQLHCYTCGFVLYGEKAVQEECDIQYAEYLKNRQIDPTPEPVRAPVQETTAAPAAPATTEASPSLAESSIEAPQESSAAELEEAAASAPAVDGQQCAWRDCEKIARPRSKYCSRNCSNKNARARHAARKT